MKKHECLKSDISRNTYVVLRNMYVLILCLALAGCAPVAFDSHSFTQTKALKADALKLMDQATDSFSLHAAEVARLNDQLESLHNYEKTRCKNKITVQQWDILLDPDGNLLGGFLVEWKDSIILKKAVVTEKGKLIGGAFDQIIELESHKRKSPVIFE